MAVVKNINKEPLHLIPWLDQTRELEKDNKESALKEYRKIVAAYPLNEKAYDRIMILLRQLKKPDEEVQWISKAIAIFENKFKSSRVRKNSKVATISKGLVRSLGLADKKGKSYYLPEPIARWTKRKEILQKKKTAR